MACGATSGAAACPSYSKQMADAKKEKAKAGTERGKKAAQDNYDEAKASYDKNRCSRVVDGRNEVREDPNPRQPRVPARVEVHVDVVYAAGGVSVRVTRNGVPVGLGSGPRFTSIAPRGNHTFRVQPVRSGDTVTVTVVYNKKTSPTPHLSATVGCWLAVVYQDGTGVPIGKRGLATSHEETCVSRGVVP